MRNEFTATRSHLLPAGLLSAPETPGEPAADGAEGARSSRTWFTRRDRVPEPSNEEMTSTPELWSQMWRRLFVPAHRSVSYRLPSGPNRTPLRQV